MNVADWTWLHLVEWPRWWIGKVLFHLGWWCLYESAIFHRDGSWFDAIREEYDRASCDQQESRDAW